MTDIENQDTAIDDTSTNDLLVCRQCNSLLLMNTQNTRRGMLTLLALAALSVGASAQSQDIRVTVDGEIVSMPDVQPIMVNNRVMVPVRGVFEHMNATVEWNSDSQTVFATYGTHRIQLPVNSYTATVDGRSVSLDSPAIIHNGRTIVPLRFLSESMGAEVKWESYARQVTITSATTRILEQKKDEVSLGGPMVQLSIGSVIPFKLERPLSSKSVAVGDTFSAVIDSGNDTHYQNIPKGTTLEGHVDVVRAKTGDTPGVLGLAFDRLRLPNGSQFPIYGSLIGLDSKSIENLDGRLTAKPGAKVDNLRYVGYGAGGGALVAILTKGNILTSALIGGALGFLLGEIQKDPSRSRDVSLETGAPFGVRLTRDMEFRPDMKSVAPKPIN